MTVDLSNLTVGPTDQRTTISLGTGQLAVTVPAATSVDISAEMGGGVVEHPRDPPAGPRLGVAPVRRRWADGNREADHQGRGRPRRARRRPGSGADHARRVSGPWGHGDRDGSGHLPPPERLEGAAMDCNVALTDPYGNAAGKAFCRRRGLNPPAPTSFSVLCSFGESSDTTSICEGSGPVSRPSSPRRSLPRRPRRRQPRRSRRAARLLDPTASSTAQRRRRARPRSPPGWSRATSTRPRSSPCARPGSGCRAQECGFVIRSGSGTGERWSTALQAKAFGSSLAVEPPQLSTLPGRQGAAVAHEIDQAPALVRGEPVQVTLGEQRELATASNLAIGRSRVEPPRRHRLRHRAQHAHWCSLRTAGSAMHATMARHGPALRIATRSSPLALWQARPSRRAARRRLRTDHRREPRRSHPATARCTRSAGRACSSRRCRPRCRRRRRPRRALGEGPPRRARAPRPGARLRSPSATTRVTAWSGSTLDDLPQGATVATGSVRRRAQLAALRPDLVFVDLRGNMATRLAKVPADGAVVAAYAALAPPRLGRSRRRGARTRGHASAGRPKARSPPSAGRTTARRIERLAAIEDADARRGGRRRAGVPAHARRGVRPAGRRPRRRRRRLGSGCAAARPDRADGRRQSVAPRRRSTDGATRPTFSRRGRSELLDGVEQ